MSLHMCATDLDQPQDRDQAEPAVDSTMMLIRQASQTDWPGIYAFFRSIVADGTTYAYPPDLSSADARALWLPGPDPSRPSQTVVAIDGGDRVLGSATMGPNRPGRGSHVATASFMVDPDARGQGVGRQLGQHVLDWASSAGYAAMQFNAVVETNSHAVALWHSLGFTIVGTVPDAFDHATDGLVGLHVMHRTL